LYKSNKKKKEKKKKIGDETRGKRGERGRESKNELDVNAMTEERECDTSERKRDTQGLTISLRQ
jgi:hypothetical protein